MTENNFTNGTPLTTGITSEISPGLLRNAVDERIVKIRPASTPLDQISRMSGARQCSSMRVDYYSVDCKPGSVHTTGVPSEGAITKGDILTVTVDRAGVVSPSETVIFPSVPADASGSPAVCYVKEVDGKKVTLILTEDADFMELPSGSEMVRMGRAAGELDVQTPQFSALPRKEYNYCQIFKAQIEESLYQRLADKEIGWSFTDQEEVAIVDMRLGMEKTFLFGHRNRLMVDPEEGKEIYLTSGIWRQAGKEWSYDGTLTSGQLAGLMKEAFTGGGTGSNRKVLIGGSGLIEALSKLEHTKVVGAVEKETVWGVDFDRIVSKFGTLYVIHSEVFDLCGKPECGMVIDPEYITKYSHVPFQAERISFHKQGVRNTEAVVLTESSCLVLRYPEAHIRITVK